MKYFTILFFFITQSSFAYTWKYYDSTEHNKSELIDRQPEVDICEPKSSEVSKIKKLSQETGEEYVVVSTGCNEWFFPQRDIVKKAKLLPILDECLGSGFKRGEPYIINEGSYKSLVNVVYFLADGRAKVEGDDYSYIRNLKKPGVSKPVASYKGFNKNEVVCLAHDKVLDLNVDEGKLMGRFPVSAKRGEKFELSEVFDNGLAVISKVDDSNPKKITRIMGEFVSIGEFEKCK